MRVIMKSIIQAAIFAFFSSVVHADSHSEAKIETEQETENSQKLENSEERMNKVIALQEKRDALKKLNLAWTAYKNKEYQVAIDQWQELATKGNNAARVFLGLMHSQGQGFNQDDVEAANWYMLASDEGYIPAQWRLAILHYHGSGVPQDYRKAFDLYTKVAQSDDPYAQKMVGMMHSNGLGVQQDKIKAHMWFQISAENGMSLALKEQEKLATEMAPGEVALANGMAIKCIETKFLECDY